MAALAGFTQFEHGATRDDFAAMAQKSGDELFQVQ